MATRRKKKVVSFGATINKPVHLLKAGDPIWCMNQKDIVSRIYIVDGRKMVLTGIFGCFYTDELVVKK